MIPGVGFRGGRWHNGTMANRPRFHAPDLAGDRIDLPAGEAHHALHVLRLGPGAEVELFDGLGSAAEATITQAARAGVTVKIRRRMPPAGPPRPAVHLAFAMPKGKRLDWLLEKATELAAASLTPVSFQRSVAGKGGISASKRDRWLGQCIAAAKQCGLNRLPELHPPAPLAEVLAGAGGSGRVLGDAGPAAAPIGRALADVTGDDELTVLVGPEGGLSDAERHAALAAGFAPVRLGTTVLRVETAAVALLAAAKALAKSDTVE